MVKTKEDTITERRNKKARLVFTNAFRLSGKMLYGEMKLHHFVYRRLSEAPKEKSSTYSKT